MFTLPYCPHCASYHMGGCHRYVDPPLVHYGFVGYAQDRHDQQCYSCGGNHPTEWCSRDHSPPRSLMSLGMQGWRATYDEDVPSTSAWRPPSRERAAQPKKKQKQRPGPRCVLCRGQHQPYNCDQFKTPQARMDTAKAHSLCLGCLHKGHRIEECRYRRPCAKCKGDDHHIAFCEGNRRKPKTRSKGAKKAPMRPKEPHSRRSPLTTPPRVPSRSSVEFVVRLDAELEGFFNEPDPSTSLDGQRSPVSTKCSQWKMWTPADAAEASGEYEDTADDGLLQCLLLEDEWENNGEDDSADKTYSSSSIRVDHLNNPPREVFLRRSSELGESGAPEATQDTGSRPSAELEKDSANTVESSPPQAQALADVRDDSASGYSDIEIVGVMTKSVVKAEIPSNHTVNLEGLRSVRAKRLKDCRAQLNDDKLEFEEERLLFADRKQKFEEESERDRTILDDEWRHLRIEKESLAADRDALEGQRSQASKAHAMLRQYKVSLDAQKADVEGRKTALITRDLRLDAREKELDERHELQETRAGELNAKEVGNDQLTKELDGKKVSFEKEKTTFEDAKRQAEDAGKLLSTERARLFKKSATLAVEEADLRRRRRELDEDVEAFNTKKDLAKRTTTSTTGASSSTPASKNDADAPATDRDQQVKKLKQLLLAAKTELEDAQHQNAVQKEQLDRASERQAQLERDLEFLKNEMEALRVYEKECRGVQTCREFAAPQVNAAANPSDELSELERENTVLRLSLEFRKERSQRVLERQRRLYVLKRRDGSSTGAKTDPKESAASEASGSWRAAVTTAIPQRPQPGTKSVVGPQKAPTTDRKPPAKWTDDAKQTLIHKLREVDGKFPAKTVQIYADFIAANLQSPVKLEELLSFLRKRDADNATVVERIARLALSLGP